MSASRRRKATTSSGGAANPTTAAPLERRIKQDLTVGVKRRLGLSENEPVPAHIQGLVDSAAHEVAENSVATAVVREVTKLRPSLGGNAGADPARASSDLALLQEAEHLAAKKKALRVAGFSNDEAMRLLVAEITGRASQR
jgi:hypothetical protein